MINAAKSVLKIVPFFPLSLSCTCTLLCSVPLGC